MDLKEYQKLCKLTARKGKDVNEDLCNWGLGVSGEAGDIASCIKKLIFHQNDSIKDGIKENIGDMMWYSAMICNSLEWDFEKILEKNIKKLKERYPKGFGEVEAQRKGTMIKWSGKEETENMEEKNENQKKN